MSQTFRNITYLSDTSGTGCWRVIWPINQLNCIRQGLNFQSDYSQTPILDQNYYKGMTSITVQRWISANQRDLYCKFFKPIMDHQSGWLIYEIDDLMFDGTLTVPENEELIKSKYGENLAKNGIPQFNRGRAAFEGKEVQTNIKDMLNAADFVTVTTDYLKEIYHDLYGVPLENIIARPNFLPRYLFDDRFDPDIKLSQFKKYKAKPRIGIVSSLSHYNVDNVREDASGRVTRKQKKPDGSVVWINEDKKEVPESETHVITDDSDEILDAVRSTVDEVQWVFFGFCPPKLKDLADAKKIEVHGGVPIMNYASRFDSLELQAVVAAIKPMPFNFSKSFIKTMECAALGVPCFATNCLPYNRVMPSDMTFSSSDELVQKIRKLKFMSAGSYRDIIDRQWKWLNSPCHEGDFDIQNFWLEDNLRIFVDMNRLRQKTLSISMSNFAEQYEKRKENDQQNTIYKNANIQIMK